MNRRLARPFDKLMIELWQRRYTEISPCHSTRLAGRLAARRPKASQIC